MVDKTKKESSRWKEEVHEAWRSINLEGFCAQIGIDFQSNFERSLQSSEAKSNPYPQYRWEILPNTRIQTGVLHLVPPSMDDLSTLWEEWFIEEEKIHHHVLRNHPHDLATGTWFGESADTDHPREVLGIHWYHSNDADLRPIRFR